MKLVIAEKPSVAQSLARVIGADKRRNGYLEGGGYLVSWCVGHLVELSAPERYDDALPNGVWKTCRSCRNAGCMRSLRSPGSSIRT